MQSKTSDGNVFRRTQIAYECRLRVSFLHVQDVAARDAVTAETLGVAVVADLQDPVADIGVAAREEPLNIKTVYWCPAIKAEFAAKGRHPAEIPKPRRPSGKQATEEVAQAAGTERICVSGSNILIDTRCREVIAIIRSTPLSSGPSANPP